jgi:hypothetical protein
MTALQLLKGAEHRGVRPETCGSGVAGNDHVAPRVLGRSDGGLACGQPQSGAVVLWVRVRVRDRVIRLSGSAAGGKRVRVRVRVRVYPPGSPISSPGSRAQRGPS